MSAFPPSLPKRRPEDNRLLLQEDLPSAPPPPGFKTEFFGHFRGFSLTPIKTLERSGPPPVRAAPPVPCPPVTAIVNPVVRNNSTRSGKVPPLAAPEVMDIGFLLPQPTVVSRPVISSPILENSTCTAKEVSLPTRAAPAVPTLSPAIDVVQEEKCFVAVVDEKKNRVRKDGGSTINRIASFLKTANDWNKSRGTDTLQNDTTKGMYPVFFCYCSTHII